MTGFSEHTPRTSNCAGVFVCLHRFCPYARLVPMKSLVSLLPYAQIAVAAILVAFILLQKTGAQMGGAFGGSDNWSTAYHTRRGLEKGLFVGTIIAGIVF